MMHVAHRFQIYRYFRGLLDPPMTARLLDRLWTCVSCRAEYRRRLLIERVSPVGEACARDRLWASIQRAASAGFERAR